jgi:hypothetical protein
VPRFMGDLYTLKDLVARIFETDEFRIHVGGVSHEDYDDMSRDRFRSGFKVSDDLIILPRYRPGIEWGTEPAFPWLLGAAPIDYRSRLEAELTRHRGGFEQPEEDDAVVGEVDGIEIRRAVTVYRRTPPV